VHGVGLFRKKDKDDGGTPRGGIGGAFAQLREAERIMQAVSSGEDPVTMGERMAAAAAGDVPLDRSQAVTARAKVISYEGHDTMEATGAAATPFKEHAIYVVEVHPDQAPAFRAEAKGWVHVNLRPEVDDVINVLYVPGTKHVQLDLAGDPRYDYDQKVADQRSQDATRRQALLDGPVSQEPLP
jgi:hypothetical protein